MELVKVILLLSPGLSLLGDSQTYDCPDHNGAERPSPCVWRNLIQKERGFKFLEWLIAGCTLSRDSSCERSPVDRLVEYEGYDGWYNNIGTPSLGAVDTPLQRVLPSAYSDGVYRPVNRKVNPLEASNRLMKGESGLYSKAARTAFSVYYGQQVVEEILDSQGSSCPPEYHNIKIDRKYRGTAPYLKELPFHRTRYDATTGFSPNNPRQQLNEITPYFDGGLVYGASKGWADVLRILPDGKVAPKGKLAWHSQFEEDDLPAENTQALPMANPPAPTNHSQFVKEGATAPVERFFKLGNARGNENPFLLSFGILWFRWHNHIADYLHSKFGETWSEERIFNEARKWVIATYQSITLYDWLPKYLGKEPQEYKRYNPNVNPQVSHVFQSAAMRFGHTLVTSGGHLRETNLQGCNAVSAFRLSANRKSRRTKGVRTCNSFWRSPELFTKNAGNFEKFLLGLSSQSSEREDHIIVEDLREKVFGPLEFSRRDLMALNIQRGRDHGLPDYNTARKVFGLQTLKSLEKEEFKNITGTEVDDDILEAFEKLYKEPSQVDIWVGGLLETTKGPGQLFSKIILDQFERSRDGDRYWFENRENELFSEEEISRIRQIRIIDVLLSVTTLIAGEDIQEDPFTAVHPKNPIGNDCQDKLEVNADCTLVLLNGTKTTCKYLHQFNSSNSELCTELSSYDYFSDSEVSYILTFTILGILCIVLVAIAIFKIRELGRKSDRDKYERVESTEYSHKANERIARRESRDVIVEFDASHKRIHVKDIDNRLLRTIDFTHVKEVTCRYLADFTRIVLSIQNHYDLYLRFQDSFYAINFKKGMEKFFDEIGIIPKDSCESRASLSFHLKTVYDREKELADFSRLEISNAFNNSELGGEMGDLKSSKHDSIEITQAELARQLGMCPDSYFVQKIFELMDKDKNGFITLQEFLDVMVVFTKDNTKKAELIFKIYDVSRTGCITSEDLTHIIKTNSSLKDPDHVIKHTLRSFGLKEGESMDFNKFKKIFDSTDVFQNFCLDGKRRSLRNLLKKESVFSLHGSDSAQPPLSKYAEDVNCDYTEEEEEKEQLIHTDPIWRDRFRHVSNYIRRYEQLIFWGFLYTFVMICVFVERAYYFLIEQEHGGLRRITSVGVTFTRGAASAMMFTYATLLVTMCQNLISKLRSTPFHRFFPFDEMVRFHRYVGYWSLFWTVMHVLGHAINFYHVSTQTPIDLACLFTDFFRRSHILPKFHYWCWQTITGLTGVFLTVQGAFIFIFALGFQRNFYVWFWRTHNSYPLFYFLMFLHGAGRLVQEPFLYYFFLGPCILFSLDKLVCLSRSKIKIDVISATHLPSNVVKLNIRRPINFNFKSGQWIRIASLGISEYEYHPFTISSAPHEENLTLHIRAIGRWTHRLMSVYPDEPQMKGSRYPPIYVDGPFGERSQMWWNFELVIFIASGIGVTPFSSILKDIAFKIQNARSLLKTKKVIFFWITQNQKQLEWMIEALRIVEEVDTENVIRSHIFITDFKSKYDLRTMMLYLAERYFQKHSGTSMFTGLRAITHFGRPDFVSVFQSIKDTYRNANIIGVFSCGNTSANLSVDRACQVLNDQKDQIFFKHYCEQF